MIMVYLKKNLDKLKRFYFLQLEQIRSFDGDNTKLGNAEKFFLLMGDLPQYKVNQRDTKFIVTCLKAGKLV